MVLCGNICFSGFYSDDLRVQGAERGGRMSNVLTELRILRTREHWPDSRRHGQTLKTSLFEKRKRRKKSMSSLYCYLLYFNLAQVVLCNVIGDFEFAIEWALRMVISPL